MATWEYRMAHFEACGKAKAEAHKRMMTLVLDTHNADLVRAFADLQNAEYELNAARSALLNPKGVS